MRTPNPISRDRLLQALRAMPRRSTTELAQQLHVTSQTVRRLLAELPEHALLAAGQTRRARYALRRPLRGTQDDLPLYGIDAAGQARLVAPLALVHPEGTLLPLTGTAWPVPPESRDGWWDGLPYPVYAIRPQGYLGRQFARTEGRNLGVAPEPDNWSDDDILWVLSRRGADVSGNLVLGNEACELWLQEKLQTPAPISPANLAERYAQLARQSVAVGGGGSSAAGEFPKFAALRELEGAATPHVLVKFSGAGGSAAEQRWADLLVCEHLALEHATRLPGIAAARSRVLTFAGRTFIESERFDRVGPHGRLPLCGLDALQHTFIGAHSTDWPELARRLHGLALLDAASVAAVDHLWWFGRLVANTDMHLGNLSFHVDRTLRLAPAYDMLPMAYAPLAGGEVPPRDFTPVLPLPPQRATWFTACAAAVEFWRGAAADSRVSDPFRSICRANAMRLRDMAEKV
jgi:hypothetical protein